MADDEIKCPKCGDLMRIRRRVAHSTRPACERQTLECVSCGYSTLRTVDVTGRTVRSTA